MTYSFPRAANTYLRIEDYALIGNGQTTALVGIDGSIDWSCLPRMDSPSVFARILDADQGGYWQIAPRERFHSQRRYLPDTNVISTTFETETGVVELVDFMPYTGFGLPSLQGVQVGWQLSHGGIVRLVRGQQGAVEMECRFAPRFDYARITPTYQIEAGRGAQAQGLGEELTLRTRLDLQVQDDELAASFRLSSGEQRGFAALYHRPGAALWPRITTGELEALLERDVEGWRKWSARCTYTGPYSDAVRRSALVLKLLDYLPTGAIVAAPTTSLPEGIGGVRNWDYRYAWIRDIGFILYALQNIGYQDEAEAFLQWMLDVASRRPQDLQIMYGIEGERELVESTLPHLEGYRQSQPVRVGNAAYNQRQLDIYGEILDAANLYRRFDGAFSLVFWQFLRDIVAYVCEHWRSKDSGIWEVRNEPRRFTYSNFMCWVALDRGIRIAEEVGLPADLERWRRVRAEIHQEIMKHGYNQELGAFTQAFGDDRLDASALSFPLRNFLPADHPYMRSTIQQIAATLSKEGLVYRYLPRDEDPQDIDGLPGHEGAFVICSFWLVECYTHLGQLDKARNLLEHLLSLSNDVGLYAEELDPDTHMHLGNFPQGFSHLALINAVVKLQQALERSTSDTER